MPRVLQAWLSCSESEAQAERCFASLLLPHLPSGEALTPAYCTDQPAPGLSNRKCRGGVSAEAVGPISPESSVHGSLSQKNENTAVCLGLPGAGRTGAEGTAPSMGRGGVGRRVRRCSWFWPWSPAPMLCAWTCCRGLGSWPFHSSRKSSGATSSPET